MKYQFLDNAGNVTEAEQESYADAQSYAESHNLMCLSMPYDLFVATFRKKIKLLEGHAQYSWLSEYAEKIIRMNQGFGYQAIAANDFMEKIIIMPLADLQGWLEENAISEGKKGTVKPYQQKMINGLTGSEKGITIEIPVGMGKAKSNLQNNATKKARKGR